MTTRLTGAFIEIYEVDDLGGVETETLIAATKDDITISGNVSEASATAHMESRESRKPIRDSPVASFGGFAVTSLGALTTLGLKDGSGIISFFSCGGLDLRVKVYECVGDVAPTQSFTWEDVQIKLNDLTWPQDNYAMWTGEFPINGAITQEVLP